MNFLGRADGIRMWGDVLQLAQRGQIKPVVGRHIEFDDIPTALEAIERRQTMGKTIARAPGSPIGP
jgi:NADPH:quinone reductase-like Zn-dependent oxidoreductase